MAKRHYWSVLQIVSWHSLASKPIWDKPTYTTKKCFFEGVVSVGSLTTEVKTWWYNCLCAAGFAGVVLLQNKKEEIKPPASSAVWAKVSEVGLDSFKNRCNRNLTLLVILQLFQSKLNNDKVTKCISTTHGVNLPRTAYDNFTSHRQRAWVKSKHKYFS